MFGKVLDHLSDAATNAYVWLWHIATALLGTSALATLTHEDVVPTAPS